MALWGSKDFIYSPRKQITDPSGMQDKDLGVGAFFLLTALSMGRSGFISTKFTNICCQVTVIISTNQGLESRGFFECSSIVKPFSPVNQIHLFPLVLRTTIMFLKN